jgi:hypothetical protein
VRLKKNRSKGVREGRGSIVNVASMYGIVGTGPTTPATAYVASKHGVMGFTKAVSPKLDIFFLDKVLRLTKSRMRPCSLRMAFVSMLFVQGGFSIPGSLSSSLYHSFFVLFFHNIRPTCI